MQRVVAHDYGKVGGGAAGVAENIKVYVRARPPAEANAGSDFLTVDDEDKRKLTIMDPKNSKAAKHSEVSFNFDGVFWTDTTQDYVFNAMVEPEVNHVLEGFNCCCFAYGQTGSGKTYSMFGEDAEVRGLIPRSVESLFKQLEARSTTKEVAMVCSFLEIYNDQIRDLGKAYLVAMGAEVSKSMVLHSKTSDIFESLAGKRGNPYFAPAFHSSDNKDSNEESAARPGVQKVHDEYNTMNFDIREDAEGNVFVKDLSMVPVNTLEEVMSIIQMGCKVRATHETSMNASSSRSHTVFTITIIQKDRETGDTLTGVLNLVDLAGSERLKKTESQGIRLKEALHINTSLTALGKVIMSLDPSAESTHIPFRDSKLTRILQNSLGGNSFTTVLAAVHPDPAYFEECLSTLQFANRCRNVRNNPKINYVSDNEDKDRKIKRLQDEIKELNRRLNSGEGGGGGGGHGGHGSAPPMSTSSIVSIMKKLGIAATLSPDGAIVLDGKTVAAAELGLAVGGDSLAEGSVSSTTSQPGAGGGGGFSGGFASGGKAGMNPDKMRRIVAELQESNQKLSTRSKEQKAIIEEQGHTIQDQAVEVVKYQTQLKHRDWEYQELFQEKERDLKVQEQKLKEKYELDTQSVIKHSKEVLSQQQSVIASVPETFRSYSQLLKKTDTAREKFDGPIRKEFELHLRQLEEKRVSELANIKRQYEHWLKEKDRTLVEFVDKFNKYRTKRSEHLRQCEKEIVTLYEYTEQIEIILDGVEKGKYLVQQKQGGKAGGSGRNTSSAMGHSRPGTSAEDDGGGQGGVVIPKGLKPTNPMTIPTVDLELTKRIVGKHKERQAKLEKVKEEAFHKSLHHASLSGTVTAEVDPVLQKQIRDLLVTPGERGSSSAAKRQSKPSSAVSRSASIGSPAQESKAGSGGGSASEGKAADEPALFGAGVQPSSWGGKGSVGAADASTFAAGTVNTKDTSTEIALLRAEVSELRAARKIESVDANKLTEELLSNETVQYVRYLELDRERLHKQVRDVSNQLHGAKVANSSLMRKLQHANA